MVRSTYKNRSYLNLLDGLPDCISPDMIEENKCYTLVHHSLLNNEWQLEYAGVPTVFNEEEIHYRKIKVLEICSNYHILMEVKLPEPGLITTKAISLLTYGGLWGLRY